MTALTPAPIAPPVLRSSSARPPDTRRVFDGGKPAGDGTSGKGSKAKKKAAAAAAKAGGNWDWSAQRVGCIKGIEKIVGTFFVLSVCLN